MKSDRISIRKLSVTNAHQLLDMETRNRAFFDRFTITRTDAFFTLERQVENIKRAAIAWENDGMYRFGIFLNETNELIGTIAISDILRGGIQSCYVGYSLDEAHNGKGYATEALGLIVKFGFEELKLHRIEAGVMPRNVASQRVLEKCGFVREGLARKNVNINGKWEDHYTYGIINPADE